MGEEVVLQVFCDGRKLHRISFFDRGPVKLHNHNLRAERAVLGLGELGQNKVNPPLCLQILKQWEGKQYNKHKRPEFELDMQRRLYRALNFRSYVAGIHDDTKTKEDADGFDLNHGKRLSDMIDRWAEAKKQMLKGVLASDGWAHWGRDFVRQAGIDVKKFKLVLKRRESAPKVKAFNLDADKKMNQELAKAGYKKPKRMVIWT
jgi:hypothetical protein